MVKITEINHVNVVVNSIEESKKFYCDVLGLEDMPRNPSFESRGAWIRVGKQEIHLVQADFATHAPGDLSYEVYQTTTVELSASRHFSLVITDMEQLVQRLTKYEIPIIYGPIERQGGLVQAYCYDPDHHLIEFSYFKK